MSAIQIALANGEIQILNEIVKDFYSVERNILISKEQTTVELERAKVENEVNKNYLDRI